jgi:hypothetical protein
MLRLQAVSLALTLATCAAASPLQAVLIPDSLRDVAAIGYLQNGQAVASSPAGDVLVLTTFLSIDEEGQIYRPITGTIRDREGEAVGTLLLDPRLPGGEGEPTPSGEGATFAEGFAAAGSASGNFLVAWLTRSATGDGHDLVARFFDRHGQPAGSLQVLASDTSAMPVAACNLVTRCVVAWTLPVAGSEPLAVDGRVLDSLSNPDQETFHFAINTPPSARTELSVAVAPAGHFAVLVAEAPPTVRLFGGTGVPLGGPILLQTPIGSLPGNLAPNPAVGAFDDAGNITVLFAERDGRVNRLLVQRFGVGGQPLGSSDLVNESGSVSVPVLVRDHESGRYAAAWLGVFEGLGMRVMARALGADGAPEGAEWPVFEPLAESLVPSRIDLAVLAPRRVGVYWSTQSQLSSLAQVQQQAFRLGAESCESGEEPAERSRCVRLAPGERFQVTAAFRNDRGLSAPAAIQKLTANAAFHFFRGEQNPEVVTKILDGRPFNQRFWYFSGAMSNQEYQVTAFDTETGRVVAYHNQLGDLRSLADTSSLVDAPLAGAALDAAAEELAAEPVPAELMSLGFAERGAPEHPSPLFAPSAGKAASGTGCLVPTPISLCLNQARFRVEVRWTDFFGNSGQATAVQTTSDGGYFWFFNPNNVELALKILDGRPVNGKFWVFYAALSNVRFVVRIYDEAGNLVKVYRNPPGNLASLADTAAF